MTMHEYDIVELTGDHPEISPILRRGVRGVIVDLPPGSSLAAVEVDHRRQTDVFLIETNELRVVTPAPRHEGDFTPE